jgi:WD40 repeat protein
MAPVLLALLAVWPFLPVWGGESSAPAKRTLAIPVRGIRVTGAPSGPGEWLVDFGPVASVSALAFGPEGKTLAVGGYREVLIWDLAEARLGRRLGAGKLAGQVRGLAYSADGRLLAAAAGSPGGPATVELFDPRTGQPLSTLAGPKDEVLSLALSPDGKLLAAGAADNVAYVWSLESKQLVTTLKEHGDWVLGVAFSPDGKFLATAGADKTVRLWDVATWKSESRFTYGEPVQGVAFSPDGSAMALVPGGPSAASQSIRIRRKPPVQTPSPKAKQKPAPPPPSQEQQYPLQAAPLDTGAAAPQGIVWNRQGTRIYVPASDKTVKVVAPAAGRIVASLAGHADWVYAVAANPDGSKLASAGADGTVRLWNAGGESLIATLVQLAAGTDEWLIVTADGELSGSSTGCLRWRGPDPAAAAQKPDGPIANPDAVKAALTAQTEAPAATPAARSKPAAKVPRPKPKTP